ncbi:hypothetical protein PMLGA01_090040800, partial [Plasmodium malariae]
YQMFNGMNGMNGMNGIYGGIPQYYGGMNVPMNPYYDPYGIINPLSSIKYPYFIVTIKFTQNTRSKSSVCKDY